MMICIQISLFLLITISSLLTIADPVPKNLVTRLTHYQSEKSPFYKPERTVKDIADINLMSSIARASYLSNDSLELTDIEAQLSTAGQMDGFLVHLQVGSNEVDQFLYMDTGSTLLWINCAPSVSSTPYPLFHPKESTTYEPEDCSYGDICQVGILSTVQINCNDYYSDVDGCKYYVNYLGGASGGYLGRETFVFGTTRKETLKNIVFGCAESTSLNISGILGLSTLRLSLVSQYNTNKFSYCIGDISDRSYPYNELVIGDGVELWGSVTPLIIDGKYYINLEGITIGGDSLAIDPKIFKRSTADHTGGMLVDTGVTHTFLPQMVLSRFEAAIVKVVGDRLRQKSGVRYRNSIRLCFYGVVAEDLNWFAEVKFQFQYAATMHLTPENIFQQIDQESFCLAILPSECVGLPFSILGNTMQQNFYVAYDLKRKKLSFKKMDCEEVDDYYENEEL